MLKNPHTLNCTWIGSWGPEKWPHEYLISPIECSVNWPGSQLLGTRPIYTDFNGALLQVFKRPYHGPPWSDFHQIWPVEVFHHVLPIHDIQNPKCKNKKFLWRHHFGPLYQLLVEFTLPEAAFTYLTFNIRHQIFSSAFEFYEKWEHF